MATMMRHATYERIPDHQQGIDGIEGPPPSDSARDRDGNGSDDDDDEDVERNGCSSSSSWAIRSLRRRHHHNASHAQHSHSCAESSASTVKKRKRWTVTLLLSGLSVAALIVMYRDVSRYLPMFPRGSPSKSSSTGGGHTQTIPTLLSVVDPTTQQYLYALDNPLYEQLGLVQTALYRPASSSSHGQHRHPEDPGHNFDDSMYPTLEVEPSLVGYGKPLTVSWTPAAAPSSVLGVTDDSILVLVCYPHEVESTGGDGSVSRHSPVVLEAATVAQAVATSRRNSASSLPENANNRWRIPSMPVLRYESCRFQLYNAYSSLNGSMADQEANDPPDGWWLIAQSPVFQPVHRPTAVHLALTSDPTEMAVSFVTISTLQSGREATAVPIVVLLNDQDEEIRVVEGSTTTYEASDMCQSPANETMPGKFQDPGSLHTVLLTGLTPNTLYRYRVGVKRNDGQGGAVESSEVYNFTSSMVRGDAQPFSYVVYGDQGCPADGWGAGSLWTAAMTAREVGSHSSSSSHRRTDTIIQGVNPLPIRSVHHFGDLSYARGAGHIWDEWFQMIQVFSAHVPLMIGVGNHEYDHTSGGENGRDPSGVADPHGFMPPWGNFGDDSGGECGIPTARRFAMPSSNASNGVFWYSHDFASVHTVVISSEHDLGIGSAQHEWLERDLASVDRAVTPWLVVETHRPLYEGEVAWDQNAVGIGMRREMEDLLRAYEVDLVLAGHYHAYHRTCDGLYKSRCNNGGPMHITVGSAGAHLDDTYIYANGWTRRVILGEYGYGRITVHNASALHFEFIKAGDVNDTTAGQVHDDVWIVRHR